jgi:16S rRNA (adenine(1408)-N(1))-methyltransferase
MAEASRRAARPQRRGGLPNALFVVAAAEQPPPELAGIVDELTITLPWGSLLSGALAINPVAAAGIASLVALGGRVRILASVVDGDGLPMKPLDAADARDLAERWSCHGLVLCSVALASTADIEASGSSWARRLAAGRSRPAWWIEIEKRGVRGRAADARHAQDPSADDPSADDRGRAR